MRAALHWAIEHGEVEFAQRMAGALQPFWFKRGYWSEGRRWLEDSLAMESNATLNQSIRANALYGAGMLARFQGDFVRARMLCEQSLALYRDLADQTGVLKALVQLCRITAFQDDQTAMKIFLAEAASLIETLPDSVVKAYAYIDMVISMVGTSINQLSPEAARYLDESERIHRALNNPSGVAFALLHQANRALWEGDYSLSASRFDEAERLIIELGDDHLHTRLAMSRLQLDIREGDFATARRRLENDFQHAVIRGDHHMPSGLLFLAIILHKQGLEVWSARVLGLAEALKGTGSNEHGGGSLRATLPHR